MQAIPVVADFEDAACLAFFDQLDEDREGAGGGLLQRCDLPARQAGEHQRVADDNFGKPKRKDLQCCTAISSRH
jgi:hypothetical protein